VTTKRIIKDAKIMTAVVAGLFSAVVNASDYTILVDAGSRDRASWVLHSDQNIQWVSGECSDALVNAGVTRQESSWSELKQYAKGTWVDCSEMVNNARARTSTRWRLLVNVGSTDTGGYVVTPQNTRQWIDAQCREDLRLAGLGEERVQYDEIANYAEHDWRYCVDLEADLLNYYDGDGPVVDTDGNSGTDSSTDTTGGNTGGGNANASPVCMGINDDFAGNWDGGQLSTDAFKSARGPITTDYQRPASMDANRWPDGGSDSVFVIGEGDHALEKMNPWVLLPYDQTGVWADTPQYETWRMSGSDYLGQYTSNGVIGHEFNLGSSNIGLYISASSVPASPKNRWHLVPKSVAEAYTAAMVAENFRYIFDTDRYGLDKSFPLVHESVKEQTKDFCRIRYMIGDNTNSLDFSGFAADRTRPSYPTWNTPGGDGRSYEWEVWIANHLNMNAWHTDHVKTWEGLEAGDKYLEEQAIYFRDNLEGTLIREYANEIWNFAYPFGIQTNWVWQNAPYADPAKSKFVNLQYSYGKRTYDTAGVWEQVWQSRRADLDLTVAVHTDDTYNSPSRFVGPNGERWYERADSLSPSFYFGGTFGSDDEMFTKVLNGGLEAVVADHEEGLKKWKKVVAEQIENTSAFVDRVHLYEGASHHILYDFDQRHPNHAQQKQVAASIFEYLNSERYTQHLNDMFSWWASLPTAGEPMWFTLYGVNNPVSPWGTFPSSFDMQPTYSGGGAFLKGYFVRHPK